MKQMKTEHYFVLMNSIGSLYFDKQVRTILFPNERAAWKMKGRLEKTEGDTIWAVVPFLGIWNT